MKMKIYLSNPALLIKEAGYFVRKSKSVLYTWIRRGLLPASKIPAKNPHGFAYVVDSEDINKIVSMFCQKKRCIYPKEPNKLAMSALKKFSNNLELMKSRSSENLRKKAEEIESNFAEQLKKVKTAEEAETFKQAVEVMQAAISVQLQMEGIDRLSKSIEAEVEEKKLSGSISSTEAAELKKLAREIQSEPEAAAELEKTKKKLNWYEEKQQRRKERYIEIAAKKEAKAEQTLNEARKMASAIPFGQPILVGHHSEKSDRNYRKRMDKKYDKGFEEYKKAEYYEDKAKSVGTGGISSDDPDAISKLEKKLEGLKDNHKTMLLFNKLMRQGKTAEELATATGLKIETVKYLLKPQESYMKPGFEGYALSNSSQNIKSVEKRIKELRSRPKEEKGMAISSAISSGVVKYDPDENRIMFIFDAIPSQEVRTSLKQNGFKWSPYNKAWVRKYSTLAQWATNNVLAKLGEKNLY